MLTIDHGPINTEEMNRKLTSIQDEVDTFSHISKVSVKSSQEAQETSDKRSYSTLIPTESVEVSSDSHTTVRQIIEKRESGSDGDSDHEISSLHERPKSAESVETSESEMAMGQMKRSGTDSSDYELHSSIVLEKEEGSSKMDSSLIGMDTSLTRMEEESNSEALIIESTQSNDEVQNTNTNKTLPLNKEAQRKISSNDLLQRQIKDDMYEQILSQEDDSLMSESVLETQTSQGFQLKSEEAGTGDSAISAGLTPSPHDALEADCFTDLEVHTLKQAVESEVVDPDWEMLNQEETEESDEPIKKRSMTPEQALELATEIVGNVQSQALRQYEELVKSNKLPKPQPDSKFTEETKEKVEDYIKELGEDHADVGLLQKVVSKKEEQLKTEAKLSIDLSDDGCKSDAMLMEMTQELRRRSISITDDDLTTEMTHELLQEQSIDDIKRHLEKTSKRFDKEEEGEEKESESRDFKFQTSFRSHFVRDTESETDSSQKQIEEKDSEDIWLEDSKVILRKDYQSFKDKKSDADSVSCSSSSRHNLKVTDRKSDYEGYSSPGETSYFSAHEPVSGHSRPTSSDVEVMLSAVSERSTTDNSEFLTAQDHSSADTSASQYITAASTLSSLSVKSESSGHLGSVEVSECSETLVESSLEYEHRLEDGSDTPAGMKHFDDLSADECEQSVKRSPVEFSTVRRATHARNISMSSMPAFDPLSPQEMQCLPEDDVDGTCFSSEKDKDDEEKEDLLKDNRFQIPDMMASKLSESRETLSSSVITLSNVSESTILERPGDKSLKTSTATLNQLEDVFQSTTDILTGSVHTMSSSSHSSWSTNVNLSPPKSEAASGELAEEDLDTDIKQDQVFPMPRARDSEGAQSVQDPIIPQEISVDFGSDYDSRPNSELRDVESRPLSSERMDSSPLQETVQHSSGNRSYSIDDTVSDSLRVCEPFVRPKSPMPQASQDLEEKKSRTSSTVSPVSGRQALLSTETMETELAFSQHFTQVFDESEFEIIKTNDPPPPVLGPIIEVTDLPTPDSPFNSESMEISQGEDFSVKSVTSRAMEEQDDLIVGSPPMVSRPLGVKYWPPVDNLDKEYDDSVEPMEKVGMTRSESDDNNEASAKFDLIDNNIVEKDVEDQKKWLESQFDGNQNMDEYAQYGYGAPLDQILEEEEDRYSHSSEDLKELQRFKESLSSTPDFDQIMGRRLGHVSKSGDQDDLSMGSLTEFERLEREVALGSVSGSGSHGSLGSNDSLETGNAEKQKQSAVASNNLVVKVMQQSKSGTGDDVSVASYNSLRSFEMMEQACKEAEVIEKKAKQQEEVLSEIEEGHESQDSESAETISEFGEEERSEKDYEDRLFEIDTIIKQAQANVEKFDDDKKPRDEISLKDILGRPDSRTESVASSDSLDDPKIPDLPRESSAIIRQSSLPTRIQSATTSRATSVASLKSVASTMTQFDPDSMQTREADLEEFDLMQASMDSLDNNQKLMITSTDSLEGAQKPKDMVASCDSLEGTPRKKPCQMTISTDSIENTMAKKDDMTTSIDSLEGGEASKETRRPAQEVLGASAAFMVSTDSIESSSTNTRATASMLSSFYSQGSETLVADDELEHDNDHGSTRRLLLEQGNLPIEDSDDSVTYSSPQVQRKSYQHDRVAAQEMVDSIEEVLETEEIDEKGNIIVKKVIRKRTIPRPLKDTTEKRDDSCEETIEEVDEFGTKRKYIVKTTLEQSDLLDGVIQERRQQRGLSPVGEMFKNVTDVQSPQSVKKGLHHTEKMTKIFDVRSSTPSPPSSPSSKSSSFKSQIPIRKQ